MIESGMFDIYAWMKDNRKLAEQDTEITRDRVQIISCKGGFTLRLGVNDYDIYINESCDTEIRNQGYGFLVASNIMADTYSEDCSFTFYLLGAPVILKRCSREAFYLHVSSPNPDDSAKDFFFKVSNIDNGFVTRFIFTTFVTDGKKDLVTFQ